MTDWETKKRIEMPYKKEQRPTEQSYSGVRDPGKACRQRQAQVGQHWIILATTSLSSPTPLKFLQVNSQTKKNMGSYWHGLCLFCQYQSKDSLDNESYRPDSPGNKKPDWIGASEWWVRINQAWKQLKSLFAVQFIQSKLKLGFTPSPYWPRDVLTNSGKKTWLKLNES